MTEATITREALLEKYNTLVKKDMAKTRKLNAMKRENDFLHKVLCVLTLVYMATAILVLR